MSHRDWKFEIVGVERIVDGDTFWLRLDVGFRQTQLTHLRLMEYDTPEIWGSKSEYELTKAHEATQYVRDWIDQYLAQDGVEIMAITHKDPDSFGRWLAELVVISDAGETVANLGADLHGKRLASVWPTRWRDEFGEDDGV